MSLYVQTASATRHITCLEQSPEQFVAICFSDVDEDTIP